MSVYRSNSCCRAVLASCVIALAQDPKPPQEIRISAKLYTPAPAPLRVETDLIEVGVVVRNHDGRAIPKLKRENFVLTDQGAARELTYFAVETPGLRPENSPMAAIAAGATPSSSPNAEQPATAGATPHPRFIVLYFDDFGTNNADLKRAQVAGRRFIKEGLDDTDRVALISSSGDFLDYTADQPKLIAAIDKLKPHPKFSEIGLGGCPRISPYQAYEISVLLDPAAIEAATKEAGMCNASSGDDSSYGGTARLRVAGQGIQGQAEILWGQVRAASQATLDAISRALGSLQAMPGRRLFLLVSSGFNSATLERERDQLISQALRAGIVISSVDAKGLYAEVPGRDASDGISVSKTLPFETFRFETSSIGTKLFTNNQVMSDLAQATGGLFFHNNNDLPHGFRQLGSIPEVSYVLGFHRPDTAADGKYHKLKVTLRESNSYVIQARPGYFATPTAPSAQSDPLDRERELDRQVTGTSTRTDFPASVAFKLDPAPTPGLMTVKTQVHVAIDKLQFPIRNERRMQHLNLVVALLDEHGNIVAAKQGAMDFAMTDATYTRFSTSGINAGLNLDAPPGKYRLRAVIQESVDGKIATSSLNIEVK